MTAAVSLGVPVYNGANFLREALDSIARQTFQDIDIIIVDNASTDDTPRICREFADSDSRVRYHRMPENIGASGNFNHAFALSESPYFKWCAHDDFISPNYVERCFALLESRPDATFAFGRTEVIDDHGQRMDWPDSGFMPALESDNAAARFGEAIRRAGTCFPLFALFRSEALRRSTLHRPYYGSDRAFLAEMALLGKSVIAEDAVFYNRHHGRRSNVLKDHTARQAWISTQSKRARPGEHISLTRHLYEIAMRHGDVASRKDTLAELARARLTPRYVPRYALDVLRLASPSAAATLRDAWAAAFRREDDEVRRPPAGHGYQPREGR